MDRIDILTLVLAGLTAYGLPLIFWIGAFIFSVVMLKRDGGKAEKLLITGTALNILVNLVRIPLIYITISSSRGDSEMDRIQTVNFAAGLTTDIIYAAGVICIIYAFWLKYNEGKTGTSVNVDPD